MQKISNKQVQYGQKPILADLSTKRLVFDRQVYSKYGVEVERQKRQRQTQRLRQKLKTRHKTARHVFTVL